MNEFVFENQGTTTYLVYGVKPDDVIDSMSLGMLTNNKISGISPALFMQMDTSKYIKYNVAAKVSVRQFFSGAVNKKRLIGVFRSITEGLLAAEEYMIDTDTIIMNLDYIFVDVSTCEASLICLPVSRVKTEEEDLGRFFKNIMFTTQFDQTENCDYVARIINFLNNSPIFSLYDFKALLDEIINSAPASAGVPTYVTPVAPVPQPVPAAPAYTAPTPSPAPAAPSPYQNPAPSAPVQSIPTAATREPAPAPQPAKPAMTPPSNPGFAIPNAPAAPAMPKNDSGTTANGEKPMSLFYLMQHYNAENKKLYKEQKEAKKAAQGIPAPVPAPQSPYQNPGAPSPYQNSAVPMGGAASPYQNAITMEQVKSMKKKAPKNAMPVPPMAVPGMPTPPVAVPTPQAPISPAPVPTPAPQAPISPAPAPQAPYQPMPQMNFGETTVLGRANIGETTVLTAAQNPAQPTPQLIRKKNNEKILLNKPVFRIGKERSYVDYFIGDNTAISRSHANIVNRDGSYFVMDTNSTNHTFVNGNMIQSGEEVKLTHGDQIRLANEEFEFRMV